MKLLSSFSLVMLLTIISFPVTSDAFSRRSSHSEVASPVSTPLKASHTNIAETTRVDASAAAVPEPPVLWLMSLGVGLVVLGAMFRRARQSHDRE